jgi:HD superfamily phosphodiesterase
MMQNKILEIKMMVEKECANNNRLWFYKTHLLAVEKFARILLKKLPRADKDIVMLGVWLHDLQRVRKLKGDHSKIGAREAIKLMKDFKYDLKTIKKVKEIILSHTCGTKLLPKTIEAKILASADAMSHYVNDFFLQIAVLGQRDLENYKVWALEKLNRDYNKKIYFNFARRIIKKRHNLLKSIFTMN